jgi:hypothetical protein
MFSHRGRVNSVSLGSKAADLRNGAAAGFEERPSAFMHQTAPANMRRIDLVIAALSRPLRLAILGEPGSGKTSLINFLLDSPVLPLTPLGGARSPILLRYAAEFSAVAVTGPSGATRLTSRAMERTAKPFTAPDTASKIVYQSPSRAKTQEQHPAAKADAQSHARGPSYVDVGAPSLALRELEFLEVPCTSEDLLGSGRAVRLLRTADAAIWCTVAPQAWKETERRGWSRRSSRFRGRAILAVTFRDALATREEEAKLHLRLERETRDFFSARALISLKPAALDARRVSPAEASARDEQERFDLRDTVRSLIARVSEDRFERAQRLMQRLSSRSSALSAAHGVPHVAAAPTSGA